jgi:hypothetical protein
VGHTQSQKGQRELPETLALFNGKNSTEGPLAFSQKRKPKWGPMSPLPGKPKM